MEVAEHSGTAGGIEVHWRSAGDAPVLYVHGVPTASWDWLPFLERIGGAAPDLPGFGSSAKPGNFEYSIDGYADFLETFTEAVGLQRMTLVLHDWGSVGLTFAQRFPERIERLVMLASVPFLPGYRWHRVARIWRTSGVGELAMGFTTRRGFRRALPDPIAERAWADFDQGTQRAILKLYRSAPEETLARAGERLGELRCPALILWPTSDPYIPERFGKAYADTLGGETTLEVVEAGHWMWLDRPELVERTAAFIERS